MSRVHLDGRHHGCFTQIAADLPKIKGRKDDHGSNEDGGLWDHDEVRVLEAMASSRAGVILGVARRVRAESE